MITARNQVETFPSHASLLLDHRWIYWLAYLLLWIAVLKHFHEAHLCRAHFPRCRLHKQIDESADSLITGSGQNWTDVNPEIILIANSDCGREKSWHPSWVYPATRQQNGSEKRFFIVSLNLTWRWCVWGVRSGSRFRQSKTLHLNTETVIKVKLDTYDSSNNLRLHYLTVLPLFCLKGVQTSALNCVTSNKLVLYINTFWVKH